MTTYLQRYIQGEYVRVWDELSVLERHIREDAIYEDAMAVARETMRRVRVNLDTLVQRLGELGYIFGYAERRAEIAPNINRAFTTDENQGAPLSIQAQDEIFHLTEPIEPPRAGDDARLSDLQEHYGVFPLALVAWYETVGAVNLVGSMPIANALELEGFTNVYQYREVHARGHMESYRRPLHDIDPLWVYPLRTQVARLRLPTAHPSGRRALVIAPSEMAKQGFNAEGEYEVVIPQATVDARLVGERHGLTFVQYLRYCMRWGGFPGLDVRTHPPLRELALLTDNLLPL